jgi:hypothetical protein
MIKLYEEFSKETEILEEYYDKGKISNFKLYDRPLISDEILKNYNMTKSKFGL